MKRLSFVIASSALALFACATKAMDVPTLNAPAPGGVLPIAVPPSSARAVVEPSVAADEPLPGGRSCYDPIRDPRVHSSGGKRRHALVKTEYEQLTKLYDAVAKASVDKGTLALRLGDSAIELADLEPTNATTYEGEALAHYQNAVQTPGSTAVDAARYRLALAYECQGNVSEERRLLFQIVQARGPLAPYAYFAFGELFLKESATDPSKLDLALQSYAEVLKSPSPLGAVARRRTDDVRARRGTDPAP